MMRYMNEEAFKSFVINEKSQVCAVYTQYEPEEIGNKLFIDSAVFAAQPKWCHGDDFPKIENVAFIFDEDFFQFKMKEERTYFINLNKVIGVKDVKNNGYLAVTVECDRQNEVNIFIDKSKLFHFNTQYSQFLSALSSYHAVAHIKE